jgi:hypothetical protein
MSVYTVHAPPLWAADDAPDTERFTFVRDGFSMWAFLLAPLWMLWHRMWLVFLGYIVVTVGVETLARAFGASAFVIALIGVLISLLVGLEAATLRRFKLNRRRWKNVGIVCGDDLEDAERRFFDAWVHRTAAQPGAPAATAPPAMSARAPAAPSPRMSPAPDVVGLFPEPGAAR